MAKRKKSKNAEKENELDVVETNVYSWFFESKKEKVLTKAWQTLATQLKIEA